jgi:hypothetical protein
MNSYPVHYGVVHPYRFTRLQLAVRIVAFCALGVLGLSFGAVFLFAYLALPVFAASRLAAGRGPATYVAEDGRRVLAALRWFAAVSAWAGLIAEHLPGRAPDEVVSLSVEGQAHPTPSSAMWRVLTGVPSALVLFVLGWIGSFVWLWAALSILFTQRVGPHAFHYLEGLQRWSVRLLVYQASLVDDYPPFTFADSPPSTLPFAQARP